MAQSILKVALLGLLGAASVSAQGSGSGSGSGQGPGPMAQMRDVHELFANHDRITRAVTNLPDGIRTVTESDDPRVAALLKKHVSESDEQVRAGTDPGLPMESPALRAIYRNHDKIRTTIKLTDNGVDVVQTSADRETVAVLQQHAAEVTAFVKDGMAAMHAAMMGNRGGMMRQGMTMTAPPTTPAQDPHAGMNQRGAMIMGFDQEKTTHHFYLYEDGGAIDVSVKDAADVTNRDAIRSHLPHIAMMFGQGDFEAPMLVHDSAHVPGTAEMAKLKQTITYKYVETPNGGRVDIITTDRAALSAVHDFLKFQITDHKTGDSLEVKKR